MYTIDRIEDGVATIEYDGITFNIDAALLPPELKEGDILSVEADPNGAIPAFPGLDLPEGTRISVKKDPAATEKREAEIKSLMDDLFVGL